MSDNMEIYKFHLIARELSESALVAYHDIKRENYAADFHMERMEATLAQLNEKWAAIERAAE